MFARMNLAGDERGGGGNGYGTDLLPFPEVSAPVCGGVRIRGVGGNGDRPSGHISAQPRFEQDWQGKTRSHYTRESVWGRASELGDG